MSEPLGNATRAGEEWLLAHRRGIFLPWVKPEAVVVEFGPRDPWNLRAISSLEKHACSPRMDGRLLENEHIQVAEKPADLKEAFADFVFCYNALEYQLEPRGLIMALKRALRPGGIISIHALYDPDFRKPRFDRVVEHYFSWNVQTLGNLLVDCGFTFLQGGVYRYPREERIVLKTSGLKFAAFISKIADPFEQVHVLARNSP
jgi:SAM-dependent methyltransferase